MRILFSVFFIVTGLCTAERPNVLIILGDDMGYSDVGAYNPDSKIPTPNIDRIASEGMMFRDAHTTGSTCIPARFGLLTGTYPWRQPNMKDDRPLIPKNMPTIASRLKSAGYATHMVGKWHLGFDSHRAPKEDVPLKGGPLDRGFETFFGIHASTDIPPYYYVEGRMATGFPFEKIASNNDDGKATGWNNIQGAFWRGGLIGNNLKLPEVTPKFFEKALGHLDTKSQDDENPFLLYLALPSPHTPWLPAKEFVGKSGAGSYGDFLMTVDAGIGKILQKLDERNLLESTVVIFTSDNGPTWYAKDEEKFGHSSTGQWRGMKGDNFEGGHRIPFVVRYPKLVKAGSSSDALISFLDVSATLTDLAGIEGSKAKDSISFFPILKGEVREGARQSLLHGRRKKMSCRTGKWKFLDHQGSAGFSKVKVEKGDPPAQLYDLESDPGEQNNLFESQQKKVKELRKEITNAMVQ